MVKGFREAHDYMERKAEEARFEGNYENACHAFKNGIENGSIIIDFDKMTVSGNTYAAKERIKDLFKATWNGVEKCWDITKSGNDLEIAKQVVAGMKG